MVANIQMVRARATRHGSCHHPRRELLEEIALIQDSIPAFGSLDVPVMISHYEEGASGIRGGDLGLENALGATTILVTLRWDAVPIDIVAEKDDRHSLFPEARCVFANVVVEIREYRVDEFARVLPW
jgi:hypothetical protein